MASAATPTIFLLAFLLAPVLLLAADHNIPVTTPVYTGPPAASIPLSDPPSENHLSAVGGSAYKPALWYNVSSMKDKHDAVHRGTDRQINYGNVQGSLSEGDIDIIDGDVQDSLGEGDAFTINQNFIAASSPLFVILPDELLDLVLGSDDVMLSSNATSLCGQTALYDGGLTSTGTVQLNDTTIQLNDVNCTLSNPTGRCCALWYIPETLQYQECMAGSKNDDDLRSDMFNVEDESKVQTCLYRDPKALHECCTWLEEGNYPATERCITTRRNIVSHGIRVCVVDNPTERMSCCRAMFKGRTFLYERCVRGVPTFINRRAPCVFNDFAAQDLCCQQIFPSVGLDGANRAYLLCADVVLRKTSTINVCYEEDSTKREECCEQEKLYGSHPYDQCRRQDVPPCRYDNFNQREECCHTEFPDQPWRRTPCMVREFKRCQLHGWEDRLACCASLYRVGSVEMEKCLYQYIHVADVFLEQARVIHCGYGNPPGSQHFKDCLFYPIKSCELIAKGNRTALETCCADYFKIGDNGWKVCMGNMSFQILLLSYLDFDERWKPLSNVSDSSEARVSYCLQTFDLESERWARYACLSEITFSATDPSLYHFTLFSDTAVMGHAQFACAIYDEFERESCCSVRYPGASQAFETCFSWLPTLGYTDYEEITANKTMQLEKQFTDAVHNPLIATRASLDTAKQRCDRERVKKFLEEMKGVEERLSKWNMPDSYSDDTVTLAYYKFRALFRAAVANNETGTFYHGTGKSWMTCALARSKMASDNTGVLYCGKLAVIDNKKVPRRRPVRGWEGGAIERIIAHAKTKNSFRLTAGRAAGAPWTPAVARQEGSEGSGAVAVNLFGDAETCPLANLAYSCNALCCDSYYAECWLCGWQNLQCVG